MWKDKYDLSWWTKNGIFHYPYLLISYWYEPDLYWRDKSGVLDDITIMGDCGAYSAVSAGVNLDPVKVVEWQMNNSEIGLTLDDIPAKVIRASQAGASKVRSVNFEEFKKHAQRSKDNYCKAIDRATGSDLQLLAVMHGDTTEKWDFWWNLIKDLPVSGYGTGLKPTTDAVLQLSCLARLHNSGVRSQIHLLGVSGTNVIPALAWASKHFKTITFDSLSYGQGSISKMYMQFQGFNRKIWGLGNTDAYPPFTMREFPCQCAVCQEVEDPNRLRDEYDHLEFGNDTMSGLLISLHNLNQYREYVNKCEKLARSYSSASEMIAALQNTRSEGAIAAINFWEDYLTIGLEKTLFRWREQLRARLEKDHDRQMELF